MAVLFQPATQAGYSWAVAAHAAVKARKKYENTAFAAKGGGTEQAGGGGDSNGVTARDEDGVLELERSAEILEQAAHFPPSCHSLRAFVARGNHFLMLAMLRQNGFADVTLDVSSAAKGSPSAGVNGPASLSEAPWCLCWTGSFRKNRVGCVPFQVGQRVNHFPRTVELSRKDRYHRAMRIFSVAREAKSSYSFVPESYTLPIDAEEARVSLRSNPAATWIQKPVDSSRGLGIFLFRAGDKLAKLDRRAAQAAGKDAVRDEGWLSDSSDSSAQASSVEKTKGRGGQAQGPKSYVISRYIDNPLLIHGKKFDLRLYVAFTSFDPLEVYLYEDGLVRFATQPYRTGTFNRLVHLTNYSVNKLDSKYEFNTDADSDGSGSKWSVSALLRHLETTFGAASAAKVMADIEAVVVKSALAAAPCVRRGCRLDLPDSLSPCCFEFMGFDVLIDDELKPWILETNLSPSITCDSPLDFRLKSRMLADLLNLVGVYPLEFPQGDGDDRLNTCTDTLSDQGTSLCRCHEAISAGAPAPGPAPKSEENGWRQLFPVLTGHPFAEEYASLEGTANQ